MSSHKSMSLERTPHVINSAIVIEATKQLVEELLLGPQGMPTKHSFLKSWCPSLTSVSI
jgi:hypothetical protein